ncbi:TerC family protein [Camelliibacillus cellulosilyticus]|uniref:TerC family protein n=1 Tax=Camelliibacillus cellulosilyticus TaxID=2174486 RepID=A0ABV9GPM0_9BACL
MAWTQETVLAIINIILIDLVLGGDNAVVIALACRKLPERTRNRAIVLGAGLAVLLRVLLTAIMLSLLQIPYLQLVGGILLVFIAYKLIADKSNELNIRAGATLFGAIRTIILADMIMGLDNILGIAGAAKGNLWLVIIGLCISVPVIIWGSRMILIVMDVFPGFIYFGGAILAYTASGMILDDPNLEAIASAHPLLKPTITASIIISVLLVGWLHNRHLAKSQH